MTQKGRTPLSVIPSLSRDLYANIVLIFIEILRLRGGFAAAPLRVTQKGSLSPVIPSLSRDLYANIVLIFIEILRLRGGFAAAPLRMTKNVAFFNNQIARGKMTLLPKRTQFAAYLRLNSERVNAARSYNREPFIGFPKIAACGSTARFLGRGETMPQGMRVGIYQAAARQVLFRRAPQREKRMQSRVISRRTFGCLSNHGNFFHLF